MGSWDIPNGWEIGAKPCEAPIPPNPPPNPPPIPPPVWKELKEPPMGAPFIWGKEDPPEGPPQGGSCQTYRENQIDGKHCTLCTGCDREVRMGQILRHITRSWAVAANMELSRDGTT